MSRKKRVNKSHTSVKADQTFAKMIRPKFSFRRTVVPPLVGVLVMVSVIALFNLQYLEAQWRYRKAQQTVQTTPVSITPETTTTDDTKSPQPERGPLITIPAIGAEAPIVFEPSFAEWKVQVALRSGVVHYGSTANPGENGNMVILGHSSGQAWAPGDYKFVFTLLDKLKEGDVIYVDHNGTRYTYKVTNSIVVHPDDVSQIQPTTKPTLSLVTCTPVGTSLNRLVVHAEQVSPSPTKPAGSTKTTAAVAAPVITSELPKELPASANGSLWQRFLNLF